MYYESLPPDGLMRVRLLREIEKYMNCMVANKVFLMRSEGFLALVCDEWSRLMGHGMEVVKKDVKRKNVVKKEVKRKGNACR